jgi:hypothetical protein
MDDYNDLYDRHEVEQERKLSRLPRCCECGDHIQAEKIFDVFGDLYCESCMTKEFERDTDNYIEYWGDEDVQES